MLWFGFDTHANTFSIINFHDTYLPWPSGFKVTTACGIGIKLSIPTQVSLHLEGFPLSWLLMLVPVGQEGPTFWLWEAGWVLC